jgi:hypothetical protein
LITEEPRAAASTSAPARPATHYRGRPKVKANSVLAARAAEEYVYVGKDLRRIVTIAVALTGVLLVLWVLLVVLNLSGLY